MASTKPVFSLPTSMAGAERGTTKELLDSENNRILAVGSFFGSANVSVTGTETGLGAAVTRYYFARSRNRNNSVSPVLGVHQRDNDMRQT